MDGKQRITLNARGTLIEIPYIKAIQLPLIRDTLRENKFIREIYLDFSPSNVHAVLDELNDFSLKAHLGLEEKNNSQMQNIFEKCKIVPDNIEIQRGEDMLNTGNIYCTIAYNGIENKFRINYELRLYDIVVKVFHVHSKFQMSYVYYDNVHVKNILKYLVREDKFVKLFCTEK